MPQLAIFKGEKSLDDLAARLFRVNGDAQARKQATDALLRANPQLANLDRLPPGAVVVVPDTPHAVNAGEVMPPSSLTTINPVRSVGEQLNGFTSSLATASKGAAAGADAMLKLLNDQSLKDASAADPDLAQRVTAIEASTKASLKDLQDKQAVLLVSLSQMQQDLAAFLKPPPPSGGPPSPPPVSTPQPPPTGGPPSPPPAPPASGGSPPAPSTPPATQPPASGGAPQPPAPPRPASGGPPQPARTPSAPRTESVPAGPAEPAPETAGRRQQAKKKG